MTTDRKEVQRLIDIVVEEVSLVDRAANQHRFLIVKRRDDMPDTPTQPDHGETTKALPQPTDQADEPQTQPAVGEDHLGKTESPEDWPRPSPTPAPRGEDERAAEQSTTDAALASLQQAVEQLTEMLREAKTKAAPESAPPPAAPEAPETKLAGELSRLRATIQAQGQRIGQLEKRAGLPNSAPVEKSTAPSEPGDVGWPLDLNKSLDRSTVDKAVSFHDL
jgi:hypothetical protein